MPQYLIQLICRVRVGEPRRLPIIPIDRITKLEAWGVLWLGLNAGVEKGSEARHIAQAGLQIAWLIQSAWDLNLHSSHPELAIIPSASRKDFIGLEHSNN